jgi:hypothetical protein
VELAIETIEATTTRTISRRTIRWATLEVWWVPCMMAWVMWFALRAERRFELGGAVLGL